MPRCRGSSARGGRWAGPRRGVSGLPGWGAAISPRSAADAAVCCSSKQSALPQKIRCVTVRTGGELNQVSRNVALWLVLGLMVLLLFNLLNRQEARDPEVIFSEFLTAVEKG